MTDPAAAYPFDRELATRVGALPAPRLLDDGIAAARDVMAAVARTRGRPVLAQPLAVEERSVPGWHGTPDVSVRVYRPAALRESVPGYVTFHGGGFVMGDLDLEEAKASVTAATLGIVVVSVGYRLAPEHPFPAAVDDAYAATAWASEQADALGIVRDRLAVGGTSAGAGLAAVTTLLARERGGPPLAFQLLESPVLDDRLATPSMRAYVDTPIWNRSNAVVSWKCYLGARYQPGGPDVPWAAAPARAHDLSGLPPAYVTTCQFDPLRDEGIAYAQRLMQAGVVVELVSYPGTFHGSTRIAEAGVSRRMAADRLAALCRAISLTVDS